MFILLRMNFVYSSVTTEVLSNCRFLQKEIREVLLDPRGFSVLQMIPEVCWPCRRWRGHPFDSITSCQIRPEEKLGNSRNVIVIGLSGRCKKKGKSEESL